MSEWKVAQKSFFNKTLRHCGKTTPTAGRVGEKPLAMSAARVLSVNHRSNPLKEKDEAFDFHQEKFPFCMSYSFLQAMFVLT